MELTCNAKRFLELRQKYNSFEIGGAPAYVMVYRYNISLSDDGEHLALVERPTPDDEQFIKAHKAEYIEYLRIGNEFSACAVDITDDELSEIESYDEAHKPAPIVSTVPNMEQLAQLLGAED